MPLTDELRLVIWDTDPARIARLDRTLHLALAELGLKGIVTCNSEPPSLMRAGLYNRLPTLEIEGNYWTCRDGEPDLTACVRLLRKITER